MNSKQIDIKDYSYELPEERIAKYPLDKRDSSKLLVYQDGGIKALRFGDLPKIVPDKSCIVYNNTRVIHARLQFFKKTGAKIEVFCLTPYKPVEYNLVFGQTDRVQWSCMVGNLKKWKDEALEAGFCIHGSTYKISASKCETDNLGKPVVEFHWEGGFSFAEVLEAMGEIPIPPYLNRHSEALDANRYQTVYSQHNGSVAAPTAGLHFTPEILEQLKAKGIDLKEVTLHVGAGTFQPVKTEDARAHKMHGEQILVSKGFLEDIIAGEGPIIATGTTSMRTLESLYWLGIKKSKEKTLDRVLQWDWEALDGKLPMKKSFQNLVDYLNETGQEYVSAITEIMIVPGYKFKVVDALITNFHQPNSTLLLLIASFIGEDWRNVYDYALQNGFRFLSYGDSSILFGRK